LTDLESVHSRHHDVEEHDVDRLAGADVERLLSVGSGNHIEILGEQPGLEQFQVGGDIVDDQNAGGHAELLQLRCRNPRFRHHRDRT
jgi:hypothetical protein